MRGITQALTWFHKRLLQLHPRRFQADFGEELQTIFELAIHEASQGGGLSLAKMSLRELRDMPGAILFQYRREMSLKNMADEQSGTFAFEPGSWSEAFAAMAPFLMFGAFPTLLSLLTPQSGFPSWLEAGLAITLLGVLLTSLVLGLIKRVPRWFIPYLGLPLPIVAIVLFSNLIIGSRGLLGAAIDIWWVDQVFLQGQLWISVLGLAMMMAMLTALVPRLHPIYHRLREDWTLLSFCLYGAALPAVVLTFEDYVRFEVYQIAAMLLLAGGGWLYLRYENLSNRVISLLAGLTLAMAVAAWGKANLHASQPWNINHSFTATTEALGTIITWGWLVVLLLLPALIGRRVQGAESRTSG